MAKSKKEKLKIKPRITQTNLQDYMYEVRGVKVLLDADLAEAYGYETKRFNERVNDNIERFPKGFIIQLTKEEAMQLSRSEKTTTMNDIEKLERSRSQNVTAIENHRSIMQMPGTKGGRTSIPRAFTEYGVLMLGNVLKGEVAVAQSIEMVIAFKKLKDRYLYEQNYLPLDYVDIKEQVMENTHAIEDLKEDNTKIKSMLGEVVGYFSDPSKYKHFVIYQGQRVEADVIYQDIYSLAKKSLYIIDDYIGPKTVMLLKHVDPSIDIKIFSDDVNKEKDLLIDDYYKDTKKLLEILPTNNVFHDRYIIIDYRDENEKIFHSGPSSKDAGNKVSSITQVEKPELYHCLIDGLLDSSIS